ncbi:MAG: hydroxylamine reductase [Desulfobulbaceae bacterium]|jgi:hydroxylamine reductase|nr:hydroxylamine reductase [Desulfobulbaceae bacterium]
MFCNQCEQTAQGKGCGKVGVCGKKEEIAGLQDALSWTVIGLSMLVEAGRAANISDVESDRFTCKAIFSCLTNVDFDPERLRALILEAAARRDAWKARLAADGINYANTAPVLFQPADSAAALATQGEALHFIASLDDDEDRRSLKQIILYGLRGLAAYADHAAILGKEDETVYAFLYQAMAELGRKGQEVNALVSLALKCGEINVRAMELLDAGNTERYGHPTPIAVPLGHKKGKALLVSGHDLRDLELILEQSAGKGVFVYTHGEMLPCHGYPGLKKYPHFYGHYGTAWQNQQKELAAFPGAVVFTTNCIQKPADSYLANVFTTGLVGWPGVSHIDDKKNFSKVIECALALPGFTEDADAGTVMVGFARKAVLDVAGTVIEAVKAKKIRHFFLVGGCDGAKPGRNYYSELVEKIPADCLVLTLACGKFRFFDKKLGEIDGIPRLLDVGQCNDAYSAVKIALALADAFGCGVNDLPLSLILSWYEQKAVVILLSLFSLGVKNIRLGPTLPAFISPNVLNVLVDTFAVKAITSPEDDLRAILGGV